MPPPTDPQDALLGSWWTQGLLSVLGFCNTAMSKFLGTFLLLSGICLQWNCWVLWQFPGEESNCSTRQIDYFTSPSTMLGSLNLATSKICSHLFDSNHSSRYTVFHHDFTLHLCAPSHQWCCTFFHVPFGYLNISLKKYLV